MLCPKRLGCYDLKLAGPRRTMVKERARRDIGTYGAGHEGIVFPDSGQEITRLYADVHRAFEFGGRLVGHFLPFLRPWPPAVIEAGGPVSRRVCAAQPIFLRGDD